MAVGYMILVLIVGSPLIMEGIHHGNGVPFLAVMLLTSPFSWILLSILDNLTGPQALYAGGGKSYIPVSLLCASALINAAIIYYITLKIDEIISKIREKKVR